MKSLLIAGGLILTLGACGNPDASTGTLTAALGEPQGSFPSPEERLGLMAINRARSDPTTVKGARSTIFPARPPVVWNYDLSRSSRFHAINLLRSKVTLMHSSPCPLNPNVAAANCDGSPACACASPTGQACQNCGNVAAVNNCGTDTFTRIGYFSNMATGEVAAAGYGDAWATVDGWVTEAAGSDGHRRNLLDQGINSNTMGFGHASGAGCWSSFDVSDSGFDGSLSIPAIPSAAVNPARPSGGSERFYATWADASGAPATLFVVIDGQCTALQKELGSPSLNSTWYADLSLGGGCHSWYVLGRTAGGARVTYPTTGALNLSVSGGCAAEYVAQAPAASCEGARPQDMAVVPPRGDLAIHGAGHDLRTGHGGGGGDSGAGGGGVGDACQAAADCDSNVCAFTSANSGYCTAACDPADTTTCPTGYSCGTIDSANFCLRTASSGGCAVGGGPSGTASASGASGVFGLVALFGPWMRRRRTSRPR